MHVTYTSGPKFPSVSLYDEPFLSCGPIFGKVHQMTPNDLDMFKVRSKLPTCMLHTLPVPKFLSVSLYDKPCLSYGPIFGKVHQMTPNDFDMFKVKNTNMHVPYTLRPKFLSVSLYDEPFLSYGPIFGKVHRMTPNDHDMFKVKIPTCMSHTPPGANFRPFRSTMSRF